MGGGGGDRHAAKYHGIGCYCCCYTMRLYQQLTANSAIDYPYQPWVSPRLYYTNH